MTLRAIVSAITLTGISLAVQAQSSALDIQVHTPEGKTTTIRQLIDTSHRWVVLVFWATWCAPCKKELPAIKHHYHQWQSKYGTEVVAVSVDDSRNAPRVRATAHALKLPFPVVVDVNQELMRVLSFRSVPFTCIVDARNGKVLYKHQGYVEGDEKEIEAQLAQLAQAR